MKLNGLTMLHHVWRRLLACSELDECIVSIGDGPDSWRLVDEALSIGARASVGHLDDLIQRHCVAAHEMRVDAIVRVRADCVFISPKYIDDVAAIYRREYPKVRGLVNWPDRTISEGLDFELFSMGLMRQLEDTKDCPREDFATWVIERGFEHQLAKWGIDYPPIGQDLHLSVDTKDDANRAERMLKWLGSNDRWSYSETIAAYEATK